MAASLPNANDLTQRFALDVQGFDALREQAKQSPRAGAKAVAGQFDAMFTQMMLKSMRDASPDGGLFDSHTSKMIRRCSTSSSRSRCRRAESAWPTR